MFSNHFKLAFRNLWKNKTFAAINIGGLAVGLTASLLLALFVLDELRFDTFHTNADRIVRVVFRANINGGTVKEPFAMPPTAAALKNDYPEVLETARLRVAGTHTIVHNNIPLRGAEMAIVDQGFFKVFTIPILQGDALNGLEAPNTVVISEQWAKRVFGDQDPVGQQLTLKNWTAPLRIVAVMQNIPANSHFQFDLLTTMSNMPDAKSDSWMQSEFYTYLLLPEGYDYKMLEAKLPQTVEKYMGPQLQAALGVNLADFKKNGNQIGLYLQRLTDIHLYSDFTFDLSPGGDPRYVWLFGAVALFLLLIACINFTNLSTANATKRAKEIGIRKVVGSSRYALIRQFLAESFLMTGIAYLLALGLVALSLPYFEAFTGKDLDLQFMASPAFAAVLIGIWIGVGLLAGGYPAFLLSGFKPNAILTGASIRIQGKPVLRNGLVVLQFGISVLLIISALVVHGQLGFIQGKKLGYEKDHVLVLENTWMLGAKEAAFRTALERDTRVSSVSISAFKPVGPSNNNNSMIYPDDKADQLMRTLRYGVDEQYIPTLGIQLVRGRNFSRDISSDSSAVIINQAAARALGWGEDALGHTINWSNRNAPSTTFQVIGVVEDFHFKSLHERIAPLMMVLEQSPGLIVKVRAGEAAGVLAGIQSQWAQFGIEEPLDYAFLDDYYQKAYAKEQKTGALMLIFAGLTIFIACLGLFGLAAFAAQQRTKEIGIRKVLGASVAGITGLLAKDFLKLVVIAILIASPVAYYCMNQWLSDFAYRIDMQWWMFVTAGGAAVLIAFLTVGFQSVRAALANPVKSLRSE
jgi:putative ABC transport system permease protein